MATTSQHIGAALKTFAKVGGAIILQILLFTLVGILLNVVITIILLDDVIIRPWYQSKQPIYLIVGIFLLGIFLFPLLYFFIGKKQGIKAGISKLIHEKGSSMIGFIVTKFTDKMANDPKWIESAKQNGIVKTVRNFFPGFIRTLNGLPWLLKRPLKMVFETIDFATAIEDAVKTRPELPINSPETNAHITQNVANKLKATFPPPKGKLLLVMVIVNVVVCIVIKVVV